MKSWMLAVAALTVVAHTSQCVTATAHAATSSFATIEMAVHDRLLQAAGDGFPNGLRLLSKEELEDERIARQRRMRERQERARDILSAMPPPKHAQRVGEQELEALSSSRKLSWFGSSSTNAEAYSSQVLADPTAEYDMWAQAYRMLGGYIDCDHSQDGDNQNSGSGDGGGGDGSACARWMIWAAVRDS
jgi:hypothetical protein